MQENILPLRLPKRKGKRSNLDKILSLYQYAEQNNIDIDWVPMQIAESLSVPIFDGYAVAINPWCMDTSAKEYCALAHEIIGHCGKHAFYHPNSPFEIERQKENIADKAMIEYTLAAEDIDQAVADGYTEIWSLAEYFNVTEDFMRKAVCWYTYGNLASELYF